MPDNVAAIKNMLSDNRLASIDLRGYFSSGVGSLKELALGLREEIAPVHLNALGHRLTAEAIYDYLVEYLKRQ
jgi:lysophospholipase L1-like esterase